MTDDSSYRKFVERKILGYLLEHPAAADSAEGVRHWWLRDAGEVSQPMVREALAELVGNGWLVVRGDAPATQIYRLNENETEAISRFIASMGDRINGEL